MSAVIASPIASLRVNAVPAGGIERCDVDRDVIRGRRLDFSHKFMPDGLSLMPRLPFLTARERCLASQVQGRTYANVFRVVERLLSTNTRELVRRHLAAMPRAFDALARFLDEELRYENLFRQVEMLTAEGMAPGYDFVPHTKDIAPFVLDKSTWGILALICHVETVTQEHYRYSIEHDAQLSGLWKDVFFFHWREASLHAILDEMQWECADSVLGGAERTKAVDDFIELIEGIDALLLFQAPSDVEYFVGACGRAFTSSEVTELHATFLAAYRYQYVACGMRAPRFVQVLERLVGRDEFARLSAELAPIVGP